ncbi:dioxygenase family protein [Salmonirosea aquatica]|uniref:Intradiol ring-cleavage dioxygenase n=1 Tax=Salmonirosea aquatica TaxID=2654236 RepID=A0A7C9F7T5_9BACT|nr:intradiol ring-cleavage dioxygenase [Cytophagaceae bacterium SJW1-29]
MKVPFFSFLLLAVFISCESRSQQQKSSASPKELIGGGCDGCEIMYIGMPIRMNSTDTSVGWRGTRTKLLVTGTVYQVDGRTPAPNVIVYYWQTDDQGYYSKNSMLTGEAVRHGARRGWMQTGADGKYALYTNRPAPYPGRDIPAHIHLSIKEPNLPNEYYVDELVFDDDPLLTTAKRKALENRGGSGVLRPREENGIQVARHDIILGLHIPHYLATTSANKRTGLSIGEESPSFTPYHAWGPDKGSKACPVCKYGRNYGILYFVGATESWDNFKKWLVLLEKLSGEKRDQLKVYLVCEAGGTPEKTQRQLEQVGRELDIQNLALTFVPDFGDQESDVYLNKLDAKAVNTFIVYNSRVIIDTYTNLRPIDFGILTRKIP